MIDLIERIGPFVGIAAFLGLSILAFLIFQQAREVRRLREWAGRAPERKAEADEAAAAAAEARGELAPAEAEEGALPGERSRLAGWWADARASASERFAALDRRLPVDPRYLLAVIAAGVIAAAVLTSGFGLFGDDGGKGGGGGGGKGGAREEKPEKIEVAVLNATQEETSTGEIIDGVPGLAGTVADEVVKPAGYKAGAETNASSGLAQTTIFFEADAEPDAEELAAAIRDDLGEAELAPMISEVADLAKGAPLALVIGQDDADFSAP